MRQCRRERWLPRLPWVFPCLHNWNYPHAGGAVPAYHAAAIACQRGHMELAWHYKLFVVAARGGWALEMEDPTSQRELLQCFDSADAATERAQALSRQLRETGDSAEVIVDES